mgnify:FL=1
MKNEKLLNFFDIHKTGKITIRHAWTEKTSEGNITLEDLYRMFKLKLEKEYESVHMD